MTLTIIGILAILAVFIVPAALALSHGVDTRSDEWNTNWSATGDSASPILGTRR